MHTEDPVDEWRRRVLIATLSAGLLGWSGQFAGASNGSTPVRKSIFKLRGKVLVDGQPATLETVIQPGARIETGADSEIVFAIGDAAFILRGGSQMTTAAPVKSTAPFSALSVLSGRLLAVFGKRTSPIRLTSTHATIGIRGTGVYVEAEEDRTYLCTCYGTADVSANSDATSRDTITAQHHDRPLYILGTAPKGTCLRPAPFINHTDQELALVESVVGRTPPNVFPTDLYISPRRNY